MNYLVRKRLQGRIELKLNTLELGLLQNGFFLNVIPSQVKHAFYLTSTTHNYKILPKQYTFLFLKAVSNFIFKKKTTRFIQHGTGMCHCLHAHPGGYQLILTCITWKNAVTNKITIYFLGPKYYKIQQNIIILAQ